MDVGKEPGNGWSIDREKNWIGYEEGNCQVVTKQFNVEKYWKHDRFVTEYKWKTKLKKDKELYGEAPF